MIKKLLFLLALTMGLTLQARNIIYADNIKSLQTIVNNDFLSPAVMKYAINITNVGDVRTLIVHPRSTIYAHTPTEACEHAGVTEDLLRISVGIEDVEDLIQDFEQALQP